jgi:hypothetical protein
VNAGRAEKGALLLFYDHTNQGHEAPETSQLFNALFFFFWLRSTPTSAVLDNIKAQRSKLSCLLASCLASVAFARPFLEVLPITKGAEKALKKLLWIRRQSNCQFYGLPH